MNKGGFLVLGIIFLLWGGIELYLGEALILTLKVPAKKFVILRADDYFYLTCIAKLFAGITCFIARVFSKDESQD
jgi:hypothetical protein